MIDTSDAESANHSVRTSDDLARRRFSGRGKIRFPFHDCWRHRYIWCDVINFIYKNYSSNRRRGRIGRILGGHLFLSEAPIYRTSKFQISIQGKKKVQILAETQLDFNWLTSKIGTLHGPTSQVQWGPHLHAKAPQSLVQFLRHIRFIRARTFAFGSEWKVPGGLSPSPVYL